MHRTLLQACRLNIPGCQEICTSRATQIISQVLFPRGDFLTFRRLANPSYFARVPPLHAAQRVVAIDRRDFRFALSSRLDLDLCILGDAKINYDIKNARCIVRFRMQRHYLAIFKGDFSMLDSRVERSLRDSKAFISLNFLAKNNIRRIKRDLAHGY